MATLTLAVPVPLETEMDPTVHTGAGVAVGLTEQVKVTPDMLNPFKGITVMLEVEDWPGSTEAGDNAASVRVKPAVTEIAEDVLALKLLLPL